MNEKYEKLVRDYLVGKGMGISNVTVNGSSDTISNNDIGYFHTSGDALSQLKIETGIIMTTDEQYTAEMEAYQVAMKSGWENRSYNEFLSIVKQRSDDSSDRGKPFCPLVA